VSAADLQARVAELERQVSRLLATVYPEAPKNPALAQLGLQIIQSIEAQDYRKFTLHPGHQDAARNIDALVAAELRAAVAKQDWAEVRAIGQRLVAA
jgi:hypothetical protein